MNNLLPRKSLVKALLVNWSRFGVVPIKIKGSTLFAGANGTGKSTILDAMTYVLCGNTQFNVAAQDRDRSVIGYVRGDTKANGEQRFLRKGGVVSYVVLEFDSPAEKSSLTVGVCIESPDEFSSKSYWFVGKDCSIDDFNFYTKEGQTITATPRNQLCAKGVRIKSADFLPKDKGVPQVMQAIGLRCDAKKYTKKLVRMMCFKPDNDINRFIRENVLEEQPVKEIDHLREEKKHLDDIRQMYEKLIIQKKKLDELETVTTNYEKEKRDAAVKQYIRFYQNWQSQLIKHKSLGEERSVQKALLEKYQEELNVVKLDEEKAYMFMSEAQGKLNEYDVQGSISQIERQLKEIKQYISDSEKAIAEIQKLQDGIRVILDEKTLGITIDNKAITSLLNAQISAEEKYSALSVMDERVSKKVNDLRQNKAALSNDMAELDKQISEISERIADLENEKYTFPPSVENARNTLAKALRHRGYDVEVHIFSEMVAKIVDPSWRDALEGYMAWNRFSLLVDDEYVAVARDLYREEKIHGAKLVFSDRISDTEIKQGSAAQMLDIPNKVARKYANFVLNHIHLCKDMNELHEHSLGGITRDCYRATGHTLDKMNTENLQYSMGGDAIRLELDRNKSEREKLLGEKDQLKDEMAKLDSFIQKIDSVYLGCDRYRFEAVTDILSQKMELAQYTEQLNKLKKNPDFLVMTQNYEQAKSAYGNVKNKLSEIEKNMHYREKEIEYLENNMSSIAVEISNSQREFEEYSIQHLEVKKEALDEYNRLLPNSKDGIVYKEDTIRRAETDRQRMLNNLCKKQQEYCVFIGSDIQKCGESYIPYYRQQRMEIGNVKAEETKEKIEGLKKNLEVIFMNDFVTGIMEKVKDAKNEIDAINYELKKLPFGQDIYEFSAVPRPDKMTFFKIDKRIKEQYNGDAKQYTLSDEKDEILENEIHDFMDLIIENCDDTEFEDYRNYLKYDMNITKTTGGNTVTALSNKQGSASNGEKQTPYFIILAASLMQCYPKNRICARIAFVDEAFSALSGERIEQMVKYFEQNGFQVMYAAPPDKIGSIGAYINSTVSLVPTGNFTNVVEGLVDGCIETAD